MPHSLKARFHRGVNPAIDDYVMSWQWRSNHLLDDGSLWTALGKLLRREGYWSLDQFSLEALMDLLE